MVYVDVCFISTCDPCLVQDEERLRQTLKDEIRVLHSMDKVRTYVHLLYMQAQCIVPLLLVMYRMLTFMGYGRSMKH